MLTAAHWLPRGLTDYNPRSATRSDVPGNRCVIIPHSMVKRKRGRFNSFSGKMHRSAQAGTHCRSQGGQQCGRLHVLALFPMSLVWAGTYLPCWYAIVKLQVNLRNLACSSAGIFPLTVFCSMWQPPCIFSPFLWRQHKHIRKPRG